MLDIYFFLISCFIFLYILLNYILEILGQQWMVRHFISFTMRLAACFALQMVSVMLFWSQPKEMSSSFPVLMHFRCKILLAPGFRCYSITCFTNFCDAKHVKMSKSSLLCLCLTYYSHNLTRRYDSQSL